MNIKDYPIIGIAGKAESGKDTVVKMLIVLERNFNIRLKDIYIHEILIQSRTLRFADLIKRIACMITDCDNSKLDSNKTNYVRDVSNINSDMTIRKLYTTIGKFLSDIDPLTTVKYLDRHLGILRDSMKPIYIPDVRFQREVDYIHSKGGIVIFIERAFENHLSNDERADVSEEVNIQYDYKIINDGSLEDLLNKLKNLITNE